MATFNFDAPTPTVGFHADCAFRMRVRRSAMGSVMLIVRASPAGLRQARNFATIGGFAQVHARQTKLAVYTARTPGNRATITLPALTRIPRLFLQLHLGGSALLRSGLRIADELL